MAEKGTLLPRRGAAGQAGQIRRGAGSARRERAIVEFQSKCVVTMSELKQAIADVPDFPRPGILFRDISPLLRHHFDATVQALDALLTQQEWRDIDALAGIESRGFILGAALSIRRNKGFVLVRKQGKLPPPVVDVAYDLEYAVSILSLYFVGAVWTTRLRGFWRPLCTWLGLALLANSACYWLRRLHPIQGADRRARIPRPDETSGLALDHFAAFSVGTRLLCARTHRCASRHQCFLMLYQTSAAQMTCWAASPGSDDVSRSSPGT